MAFLFGSQIRFFILSIKLVPILDSRLLCFWIAHLNRIFYPRATGLLWPVVEHVVILFAIKFTIIVLAIISIFVIVLAVAIHWWLVERVRLSRHHHRQAIFLRGLGCFLAPPPFSFIHCLFLSLHVLVLIDSAFLPVLFEQVLTLTSILFKAPLKR